MLSQPLVLIVSCCPALIPSPAAAAARSLLLSCAVPASLSTIPRTRSCPPPASTQHGFMTTRSRVHEAPDPRRIRIHMFEYTSMRPMNTRLSNSNPNPTTLTLLCNVYAGPRGPGPCEPGPSWARDLVWDPGPRGPGTSCGTRGLVGPGLVNPGPRGPGT